MTHPKDNAFENINYPSKKCGWKNVENSPIRRHPSASIENENRPVAYHVKNNAKQENIPIHKDLYSERLQHEQLGNIVQFQADIFREDGHDIRSARRGEDKDCTEYQIPTWAKRILSRQFSFSDRFSQIKELIEKWSLRPRSIFLKPSRRNLRPAIYDREGNPITPTRSHCPEDIRHEEVVNDDISVEKTNTIAVYILGLFLIFLFVFPVIVVIYIYTDRSDFVTVEIEMKFNGSIDQSLNIDNITRDICREVDLAFEDVDSFYGCNVTIVNGSTETDVKLIFRIHNFPQKKQVTDIIEDHFLVLEKIDNYYYYIPNSIKVNNYDFENMRIITDYTYLRPSN